MWTTESPDEYDKYSTIDLNKLVQGIWEKTLWVHEYAVLSGELGKINMSDRENKTWE